MKVARQYCLESRPTHTRPVGYRMIRGQRGVHEQDVARETTAIHSVSTRRGRFLPALQAINYLATIIRSPTGTLLLQHQTPACRIMSEDPTLRCSPRKSPGQASGVELSIHLLAQHAGAESFAIPNAKQKRGRRSSINPKCLPKENRKHFQFSSNQVVQNQLLGFEIQRTKNDSF